MSNAYSGNVETMTQVELEDALDALAAAWKRQPHLSNDHHEGVRYGELVDALKKRFNISKAIRAIDGSTEYKAMNV